MSYSAAKDMINVMADGGRQEARQWPAGSIQSEIKACAHMARGNHMFYVVPLGENTYINTYGIVTYEEREELLARDNLPDFAMAVRYIGKTEQWVTTIERRCLLADLKDHYNDHFCFYTREDAEAYALFCKSDPEMIARDRRHAEATSIFSELMSRDFFDDTDEVYDSRWDLQDD